MISDEEYDENVIEEEELILTTLMWRRRSSMTSPPVSSSAIPQANMGNFIGNIISDIFRWLST